MIKKIALLMFVFLQTIIFSQDYKFGNVSKEELEEKFYPQDSTAEAAYIYRNRKTYYEFNSNTGFGIINEFHFRIKIYNSKGFDFGTFNIYFVNPKSGEAEKVYGIKGVTYNLNSNGKIEEQKLKSEDIFDETLNEFRHVKKITMPNVKEGSVIELKYTMSSPYTNYIDDVNFQFGIPVKKYITVVENPVWLIFARKEKGYFLIPSKESGRNGRIEFNTKVRTNTRYTGASDGTTMSTTYQNNSQDVTYKVVTYESENIPALKDSEPYVMNINDYRGGVKFELVGTEYPNSPIKSFSNSWEDVSKQIYKSESFGEELSKNNYFEKELDVLLNGVTLDKEKIEIIFNFVKSNLKWNGNSNKYTEKGVKKAFEEKVGNSADINLILTSMLRYAGLNADPVLISSKGNGVPLFPTLKGFNYVISSVQLPDNSYVLLDATEPFSTPNLLPVRALNWQGRIVKKDGTSDWVTLTASKHALEENFMMVKLTDDLSIEGLLRTKNENLNALTIRRNQNHLKEEDLKTKLEEAYKIEIEDYKIGNKEDLNLALTRTIKFSSEDLVEQINGKVYIEPLLFLTVRKNPFKSDDRKYPVDFATAWRDVHRVTIEIPAGYTVEKLPEPLAIALPDNIGVFKYQVTQNANKISTVSILEFNEPMILPENYAFLKDFYGKLVLKETEKLVLVKQ
jgi:hypothetical protein